MPEHANTQKTMDDFGLNLIYAIQAGLSEDIKYPFAKIDRNGKFVIMCKAGDEQAFETLLPIFNEQCEAHQLPPLSGEAFLSRTEIKEFVKYEFNLSPESLDALWMEESAHYRGYRNMGSILRLLEPEKPLLKDDVICLFPAQDIGDNQIILRIANCNATETIATQLAFLILKYEPSDENTNACYGHYSNPVASRLLENDADFLKVAMQCIGSTETPPHVQMLEGATVVPLPAPYQSDLKPMNEEATAIYRALGVVNAEELPHLNSVEVPVSRYLEALNLHLQDEIIRNDREYAEEQALFACQVTNRQESKRHFQEALAILSPHHEALDQLQTEITRVKENLQNKEALPLLDAELEALEAELDAQIERDARYLDRINTLNEELKLLISIKITYDSLVENLKEQDSDIVSGAHDLIETYQEQAYQKQILIDDHAETLVSEEKKQEAHQSEMALLNQTKSMLLAQINNAHTTITETPLTELESGYQAAIEAPTAQLEALKADYLQQIAHEQSLESSLITKENIRFFQSEIKHVEDTIETLKTAGPSACVAAIEKKLQNPPYIHSVDTESYERRAESYERSIALSERIQYKIAEEQQSTMKEQMDAVRSEDTTNEQKDTHLNRPDGP